MAGSFYTKTRLALWPGQDDRSGIEPHLAPGLRRRIATEFDTVVQAERAVVPELETGGVLSLIHISEPTRPY